MNGAAGNTVSDKVKYRFYPESFDAKSPQTDLINLEFEFLGEKVLANATTTLVNKIPGNTTATSGDELTSMKIDSQDLDIKSLCVAFPGKKLAGHSIKAFDAYNAAVSELEYVALTEATEGTTAGTFVVNKEDNSIMIYLPRAVAFNEVFILNTLTVATPTRHILEGLYFDNDAELPNITSQCQQLGCQRIFPVIDDMRTKTFWTVSITANKAYSSFLTNGDLSPGYFDEAAAKEGKQIARPQPAAAYKFEDVLPSPSFDRVTVKYNNMKDPMATYLFFLSVANYVRYAKMFEYPCGNRFEMDLLLYPGGILPIDAAKKLQIIEEAIMHTHLNLGPDAENYKVERARIWELIKERDALLQKQGTVVYGYYRDIIGNPMVSSEVDAEGNVIFDETCKHLIGTNEGLTSAEKQRLSDVRAELKTLIASIPNPGYKYKDGIYSEVHVKTSQIGGMENKNKTVIVGSAICCKRYQENADKLVSLTSDAELVYLYAVSAHEYYHSLNGSEVSGTSPMLIYLNEAVTVMVGEREYSNFKFGKDFLKLKNLGYSLTPGNGPLDSDRSPASMAVIPEGFNSTWELITAVTYTKAPAIIESIQLMMGRDKFNKALGNYYRKFSHKNASTEEFLACMEEVHGQSLKDFARQWLYRAGYPTLSYKSSYENGLFRVELTQSGFEGRGNGECWTIPFDYAFIKDGKAVHEGLFILDKEHAVIEVPVAVKPDFASISRGNSFFGRIKCLDSMDTQELQALTDPDAVCRYLAFRSVSDAVRTEMLHALVRGEAAEAPRAFVDLFAKILLDTTVPLNIKQQLLTLALTVDDSELAVHYWQLSEVASIIYSAVIEVYGARVSAFLASINGPETLDGDQLTHMHHRAVKGLIFHMYGCAASRGVQCPEFLPSLFALLYNSRFITDKVNAINVISTLKSSDDVQRVINDAYFDAEVSSDVEIMTQQGTLTYFTGEAPLHKPLPAINTRDKALCYAYAKKVITGHKDTISTFFSICATSPEGVRAVLASPEFKIHVPDHARTLCRVWAANRKLSVLSKEGLAVTGMLLTKVASVNEMSATALVQAFNDVSRFSTEVKEAAVSTLTAAYDELVAQGKKSITTAIKAMIDSCKK